nr:hypothetical protein [Tanacetum cinerariifolium]
NGDQPLPRVTQVSIARTSSSEQPPLKDKSMSSDQEKKIQKIDRLARSLLIQRLPNDIYSLIDNNKTAKDLWDSLVRHMLGSKYGEQDRKAAVLYEYETLKATKGELLLDTYIRYLQSDDKKEDKKVEEKKRDISKVKCYNCKKECQFAKDCKKARVKDYEYYKTKMLLAKKDKDEQVLLAEDHAWMEYSSDSDQEITANMVFMAQIEKVLSDSEASSSSADDNIAEQTSSLKPYVPTVILEKIIIDVEDEVVSLLAKEKENLETIESFKSKENPKVIALGMFKLNVSQSVSPISITKTSCASKSVETKLKRKSCKRTSSKHNVNQVNSVVSRANKDFVYFSNLDTLSRVRRPKPSNFMLKKKGSSNTVKADLSSVNHSNMNKNVKRYSCKNLMACNNSDARSAFDCNNARNALCNARMNASVDVKDLFVFNDVSIRKSQVSQMNFRKKPSASLNVPSRSKSNKSLPKIMRKWLPKMQPLAEPIAKWIPRVKRQIDEITKTSNSPGPIYKWFVKKFLGTVRFGNNEFAVIGGYRDVVIRSMMIKIVYYVEGLDEASEVIISFIKKTQVNLQLQVQRVRTDNGTKFKNKTLATFFEELKKSLTTNVETLSNDEEVFHEVSDSFQGESSSSSLNDDVQQSLEEVILPQTNTQSISNDMIPNVDEASLSQNVFNE